MPKYVYDFTEGNKDLKDLLGGKGANLAEMTNLGLPVPPGFTITTEACRAYLGTGSEPAELAGEVDAHLDATGAGDGPPARRPGRPAAGLGPLRAPSSPCPGMMETVLNVGLNDASCAGLARQAGNERFAWDSYRRLIQMFGKTVLRHRRARHFEHALDEAKTAKGTPQRPRPRRGRPAGAGRDVQGDRSRAHRPRVPAGARASSSTWRSRRSSTRGTPTAPSSTAARSASRPTSAPRSTCVAMVFGNLGHGLRHRRRVHPRPGHRRPGRLRRLPANAQGEDVVAGIRNTRPAARPGADRQARRTTS